MQATHVSVRSLCVFRIVMGVGLLVFYFPTFSWLGNVPDAFFKPPLFSIASVATGFPTAAFFTLLDVLSLAALVAIIIGFRARVATIVYVVLNIIGFSFQYSFGKIDHYILPYVLLACLAFSGWSQALAIAPDKPTANATANRSLSLAAVFLCFAFFTAGFEKALNWIDFNATTSGFAAWFYDGYYDLDRTYLLAPYFKYLPFRLLEIFDYGAVLFELTPLLFLLYSRKAWRIWLLTASVFHLLNTLLLNIPFLPHFWVFLVFLDYGALFEKSKTVFSKRSYQAVFFLLVALSIFLRLRTVFNFQLSTNLFFQDYLLQANLYAGSLVWIATIIVIANGIFKTPSRVPAKRKAGGAETSGGTFAANTFVR